MAEGAWRAGRPSRGHPRDPLQALFLLFSRNPAQGYTGVKNPALPAPKPWVLGRKWQLRRVLSRPSIAKMSLSVT